MHSHTSKTQPAEVIALLQEPKIAPLLRFILHNPHKITETGAPPSGHQVSLSLRQWGLAKRLKEHRNFLQSSSVRYSTLPRRDTSDGVEREMESGREGREGREKEDRPRLDKGYHRASRYPYNNIT